MLSDLREHTPPEWLHQLRARGLGHSLSVALDVLEPFGALGAQVLWVAQPVLGWYFPKEALHELAETLETPGGIERLRGWLEE